MIFRETKNGIHPKKNKAFSIGRIHVGGFPGTTKNQYNWKKKTTTSNRQLHIHPTNIKAQISQYLPGIERRVIQSLMVWIIQQFNQCLANDRFVFAFSSLDNAEASRNKCVVNISAFKCAPFSSVDHAQSSPCDRNSSAFPFCR